MKIKNKYGYCTIYHCKVMNEFAIDMVFVKPEHRCKGIGRKLILKAIKDLKFLYGYKKTINIFLLVSPQEKSVNINGLIGFYKSLGFEYQFSGLMKMAVEI